MEENQNDNLAVYLSIAFVVLIVAVAGYMVLAGGTEDEVTPSPTPTPQPTVAASPTETSLPTDIIDLEEAPTEVPTATPTPTPTASPSPTQGEVVSFEVSGTEYAFNPTRLTVPVGATVQITFKNDGSIAHNWAIPSLGVTTKTIAAGQTDTVTFTAPENPTTAEIRAECTVSGHAEQGMVGTLVVQ